MRVAIGARFVQDLELRVEPGDWAFATAERAAILAHWQARRAAKPELFNGVVHMIRALDHGPAGSRASLLATDFRSFLYWQEAGYPAAGVLGTGAGVVLRSAEGHILLGEASSSTLHPGAIYLFSGILDAAEVTGDGRLDVARLALRELAEETGLGAGEVSVKPGFWVIEDRMWVTFAIEAVSSLPAGELRRRMLANIARQAAPEIAEVHVVSDPAGIDEARMFGHTKIIIRRLLG